MTTHYYDPITGERLAERPSPQIRKRTDWYTLALIAALAIALATVVWADDYQCTSDAGCTALQSTSTGTREHAFKKGDIVTTSSGWIVNPLDGWNAVDVWLATSGPSGMGVHPPAPTPYLAAQCVAPACLVLGPWGQGVYIDHGEVLDVGVWYLPVLGAFVVMP